MGKENEKKVNTYEIDVMCKNCGTKAFLIEAKGKKRPESFICTNCEVESSTSTVFSRESGTE